MSMASKAGWQVSRRPSQTCRQGLRVWPPSHRGTSTEHPSSLRSGLHWPSRRKCNTPSSMYSGLASTVSHDRCCRSVGNDVWL